MENRQRKPRRPHGRLLEPKFAKGAEKDLKTAGGGVTRSRGAGVRLGSWLVSKEGDFGGNPATLQSSSAGEREGKKTAPILFQKKDSELEREIRGRVCRADEREEEQKQHLQPSLERKLPLP